MSMKLVSPAWKAFVPNGSSEWLVMGGVVINANREKDVLTWANEAHRRSGTKQKVLHFSSLRHDRAKAAVCSCMADLPARYFVVASNKRAKWTCPSLPDSSEADRVVALVLGWLRAHPEKMGRIRKPRSSMH